MRRLFFGSLRQVPGPFFARLSNLELSIAGVKGRRIYVSDVVALIFYELALTRHQALNALHSSYGDVVRVGPNEVSVANWQHLRPIYANSKTVVKDPAFYTNATFVGKNNIFQMTYINIVPYNQTDADSPTAILQSTRHAASSAARLTLLSL